MVLVDAKYYTKPIIKNNFENVVETFMTLVSTLLKVVHGLP